MIIPHQLKRESFRFVKIKKRSKKPFEQDWQISNNYSYSEIRFWVENKENYGVVCGYGNLAVIDIDRPEIYEFIKVKLDTTFTVQTGSGGYHLYYIIDNLDKKIILQKGNIHYGEVQSQGQMVIGPGSLHPNGNSYKICVNVDIAHVTKSELIEVIKPYAKEFLEVQKKRWVQNSIPCKYDITKVIDVTDFKIIRSTGEYQGANPIIGSETGTNLNIHSRKNLWKDWRNDIGGDTIDWIALKHKLISYDSYIELRKQGRSLNGEIYTKACEIGREKYDLDIPMRKPGLFTSDDRGKQVRNIRGITRYIVQKLHCITVYDKTGFKPYMYIYNNGFYILDNKGLIDNEIKEILGDTWTTAFRNDIMLYLQSERTVNRDEIALPTSLINLNNGVYNLVTNELLYHSPDYKFLYKIPCNYNTKAKCPKISKYFKSTLEPEFIELSQEIFGYCLYSGYPFAAIFYLYGIGGNGKSVWIHLLQTLLGKEGASSQEIGALSKNRFASASLYGKLANICGELTSRDLKETDLIKRLTSGEYISAEFKGKDSFDFKNTAKLITACNEIPYCNDMTDGWEQRQFVIPFLRTFRGTSKDKTELKEQLVKSQTEMEGLLLWTLEGLKRLLKNKGFSYPGDHIKAYYCYRDSLARFISECTSRRDCEDYETMENIYNCYIEWCKKYHLPIQSNILLGRKLTYNKYTNDTIKINSKTTRIRRYLKLVQI